MKMMSLSLLLLGVLPLVEVEASARQVKEPDPWASYRFLIGEWRGEATGDAGSQKGDLSFTLDLGGKLMIGKNRVEIVESPHHPPIIREAIVTISPATGDQTAKATVFSGSRPIACDVKITNDGQSVVISNENDTRAQKVRLVYTKGGENTLNVAAAVAPPGNDEEFKPLYDWSATRVAGSNVGGGLPKGYVAYRASEPIKIDGKLDDPAWRAAPWTDLFVDIEGDLKPLPRFQTRAKMLWDDDYFYVAAHLQEPHVWGTLTKHDSVIFHDNDFEIFIDPDADNHKYYEIEINALNTEWDLFLGKPYRDGGPALNEWEIPGLKTAVHVEGTLNDPRDTDQFWSVEFAIPWKVLAEHANRQTPPRDGDHWRVNFSRVEWHHEIVDGQYKKVPNTPEANWVWSPQGYIDMHRPEYWGVVQFSTAKPGTVVYQPDPSLPARARLMEIYHAQNRYRGKNQAWASKIADLDLPPLQPGFPGEEPRIDVIGTGYEATIAVPVSPAGPQARWTIHQDSRIEKK